MQGDGREEDLWSKLKAEEILTEYKYLKRYVKAFCLRNSPWYDFKNVNIYPHAHMYVCMCLYELKT